MNQSVTGRAARWKINFRAPIWILSVIFAIGLLVSINIQDESKVSFYLHKSTRVSVSTLLA